jgi:hypothetical protein
VPSGFNVLAGAALEFPPSAPAGQSMIFSGWPCRPRHPLAISRAQNIAPSWLIAAILLQLPSARISRTMAICGAPSISGSWLSSQLDAYGWPPFRIERPGALPCGQQDVAPGCAAELACESFDPAAGLAGRVYAWFCVAAAA